jgi:AmiR/NasT family two-component response regulator
VCFLMLTASNDPGALAIAARLDVSGYVTKPVTPDKLRSAIVQGYNRTIYPDVERYNCVLLPQN